MYDSNVELFSLFVWFLSVYLAIAADEVIEL